MKRKTEVSPLYKAVMRRSLSEVTAALEQSGDVDELDREGQTPLFYAARDGELAIASELIRRGANVNVADKDLRTPLHSAANSYQTEVAELLLKHGASVDVPDSNGNTPLSDAVFDSKGRGDMIKLLLSHGADKTRKNNYDVSPEDLAKSIGNYDLTPFLGE